MKFKYGIFFIVLSLVNGIVDRHVFGFSRLEMYADLSLFMLIIIATVLVGIYESQYKIAATKSLINISQMSEEDIEKMMKFFVANRSKLKTILQ
jgi:hypothetical protein